MNASPENPVNGNSCRPQPSPGKKCAKFGNWRVAIRRRLRITSCHSSDTPTGIAAWSVGPPLPPLQNLSRRYE